MSINWERIEEETIEICQRLIRFDTSNFGTNETAVEEECARYVLSLLTEVGYEPQWIESSPGRPNIIITVDGEDPSAPRLLVHGHLDVVPAEAADWQHPPFAGEIHDGVLWGRGAVDMKNMVAMMLAVVRDMKVSGWKPARPLVVAFLADEEAGGHYGAYWLVENRPEIFDGCTEAISEVGGYNTYVQGTRVYLLQTAEKGLSWMNLHANGTAGHGSQINNDNAITQLAAAMTAVGSYEWPIELTPTVEALLRGVAEILGRDFDPSDVEGLWSLVHELGAAERFVGATLSTRANPTFVKGGYKVNVIPSHAVGGIDVRPIPGTEDAVKATIGELTGGMEITYEHDDNGIEVPFEGAAVDAMVAALLTHDPDAKVLPYMLSAGTDNKAFSRLGIKGYGFAPVQLPEEFDFPAMFHGVDERIPLSALRFGARVLATFLCAPSSERA